MQPLINVGPGQHVEAGLFSEREPEVGPFWYDGKNVVFRHLGVVKAPGWETLGGSLAPVQAMAQAFVEPERRIYLVNVQGNARVYRSTNQLVQTIGALAPGKPASMEIWGAWLAVAQPGEPIKVWRNTGVLEDLEGPLFDWATILKRKEDHLIAFNTSNGSNIAEWCSVSDLDTWSPELSNTAGSLPFRDLDSEIIAVADLGAALAVYSRASMFIMNYIGRPNIFGRRRALSDIGAVSRHSVVSHQGRNYGLMKQGIFVTDGVQTRWVDYPALSGYVDREVDWDRQDAIFGFYDSEVDMIRWGFLAKDGTVKGIGLDHSRNNAMTKFEDGLLMALPKQVFDRPILGFEDTIALRQDVLDGGGNALPFSIRTKPLDADDSIRYKTWQMYRFVGQWEKVNIRIGVQDDVGGEPTWVFDGPLETVIHFEWESVFLVLEFYSNEQGSRFNLTQVFVGGQFTGMVV